MSQNIVDEFEASLKAMIGQPCWSVQAGAVGSMASLHIGDKVPRVLPYPNQSLTPEEHRFQGAYLLYVEDCPWRIEDSEAVLASWLDSNAPDGPIVVQMKALVDRVIEDVQLIRPGMDLVVYFSGGRVLRIFPDQADPDEGDNYSLALQDRTFVVAARSTVYID